MTNVDQRMKNWRDNGQLTIGLGHGYGQGWNTDDADYTDLRGSVFIRSIRLIRGLIKNSGLLYSPG